MNTRARPWVLLGCVCCCSYGRGRGSGMRRVALGTRRSTRPPWKGTRSQGTREGGSAARGAPPRACPGMPNANKATSPQRRPERPLACLVVFCGRLRIQARPHGTPRPLPRCLETLEWHSVTILINVRVARRQFFGVYVVYFR